MSSDTPVQTEEDLSDLYAEEEEPEASDLERLNALLAEGEAILAAAEERRKVRSRLLKIIGDLEQEYNEARRDCDQPGAEWLRAEVKRLREEAFSQPSKEAAPPATGKPREQRAPAAASTVATTRAAAPVHETVRLIPVAAPKSVLAELEHWQAHWDDVEEAVRASTNGAVDPCHLLRGRAVYCGVFAFIIRNSTDSLCKQAVKRARSFRAMIAERLKALGRPWELPDSWGRPYDPVTGASHLRKFSDGYFRAALAAQILRHEKTYPSHEPVARSYRLRAAYQTLAYHRAKLGRLTLEDPLIDSLIEEVRLLPADVPIEDLDADALASDQPPYRSKQLAALLSTGEAPEEPEEAFEEGSETPQDPRQLAIAEVSSIVNSRPDFGADPDRLAEDRDAVVSALRQAFEAGVPASNKQLRDLILDRWPALLEGVDGMEVFLREVNAELERREEEEDEEPEQEETSDACPEGVRHLAEDLKPLMAGKHVLIIGGTPRVHTPPRLQKALGCASVSWPEVTKTDTPDKFESDLRHADVILVVKNFARHAAGGAATEVADETGAHRVILTAGYGVSKIISQLHDYFSRRGMLNGAAKDSG